MADSGDLAERLTPHAGQGSATEIADGVDRLIERLQDESSARDERESVTGGCSRRCTKQCSSNATASNWRTPASPNSAGVANPGKLVGRRLSELVRPEYAELVAEYLRRHLAGEAAPERLEVDLQPDGATNQHRLELSFARSTLDGRPAVIVTGVEMAPRYRRKRVPRSAATAARGKRSTRSPRACSPPTSRAASSISTRPANN